MADVPFLFSDVCNGPALYVIAAGRSCLGDYRSRAEGQASLSPSIARRPYRHHLKRVPPVLKPLRRIVCIARLALGLQHRSSLSPEYANLTKSEVHFRRAWGSSLLSCWAKRRSHTMEFVKPLRQRRLPDPSFVASNFWQSEPAAIDQDIGKPDMSPINFVAVPAQLGSTSFHIRHGTSPTLPN